MTIRELKDRVPYVKGIVKLPSPKGLREADIPIIADTDDSLETCLGEECRAVVYMNGLVLYTRGKYATVFRLHKCRETYGKGSARSFTEVPYAVDTNKVTASTVTKKIVGDKTEIATEDVDVKLEEVEADTFETDIQKEVDILNQSDADTIVESAFETVFGVENIPQVDFYEAAELTQENMDLSEFKFLSPVMNLIIEGEPSEENIVEVTFTVNNLTDKIEPFMLHRCEEHGWEILKAEKVGDNQIKVGFHSAGGPVAVIYRELPEDVGETETDVVAP